MTLAKFTLLSLFLILAMNQSDAQSVDAIVTPFSIFDEPEFSAILFNGEILAQDDSPDGALMLKPGAAGKFSVSTINRSFKDSIKDYEIMKPIAFRIAIHNYQTNTINLYSDKTYLEIDLSKVSQGLRAGDKVIFIPVDIRYALPRHEVRVNNGC